MIYECKEISDTLIDTLMCVFTQKNPPSDKLIASVSATLQILEDRIMASDKSILSQHVTDIEFEKYFECLFVEFDLGHLEDKIRKELGERDDND